MDSAQILAVKSNSHQSKSQCSAQEGLDPRKRYQLVNEQQKQIERERAHRKVEDRKKYQHKIHKKHLINQIVRKKRQLEELEHSQSVGVEPESEAAQTAKAKMEKDRAKRAQKEICIQAANEQAKTRHKEALKWLQREQKELNQKNEKATNLRRTHCASQNISRKDAAKFGKSMQQKRKEEQKRLLVDDEQRTEQYIKGLNQHGVHKKHPHSFSTLNIIVSKLNEEDNQAMRVAEERQEKIRETERFHEEETATNRRKAAERGEEAMERIKKQQQYDKYCQEVDRDQIKYNLKRVQAGRQNQFTGVKPMTLSQMEVNKKLRAEQEFLKMFFKGKKLTAYTQIATKYTITENKMKESEKIKEDERPKKRKPINYMEEESLIPGVSEGHYSFEEEQAWTKRAEEQQPSSKQHTSVRQEPKPIIKQSIMRETKQKAMKQTQVPGMQLGGGVGQDSEQDSNI